MSPHLSALINSIELQPADVTLVDRFIVLVEECAPSERSKLRSKIAKILASTLPRRAIEIAFVEFRMAGSSPAYIGIIVEALDALHMAEKSAVIRKLAMRFWNKQLSTDDRNLAKLAIEEHVTRLLLEPSIMTPLQKSLADEQADRNLFAARSFEGLPQTLLGENLGKLPYTGQLPIGNTPKARPTPDLVQKSLAETLPATKNDFGLETPLVTSFILTEEVQPAPIFSFAEEVQPAPIFSFAEEVQPAPIFSLAEEVQPEFRLEVMREAMREAMRETLPPASGVDQLAQVVERQIPQQDIRARISVARIQDGIPQMIEAPDVSRQSRGVLESAMRAAPVLNGKYENRIPVRSLSTDEVHANIASEDWEAVLVSLNVDLGVASNVQFLLATFERHKLERIDIRFAGCWIDALIADGQERRALRYIQQKLTEEESLTWARVCWPKIQIIRYRLELSHCDWRESDGVTILRKRVNELRPKLLCYLVVQKKAS
jgi:hypothetical protein